VRLKALENRVREEELKECSFQPKINKDYAGDTEAFYKKALIGRDVQVVAMDCSF